MTNNELSLSILKAADEKTVMIQFITKQGAIGVKIFFEGNPRWYL
jgi:hypothetical protein